MDNKCNGYEVIDLPEMCSAIEYASNPVAVKCVNELKKDGETEYFGVKIKASEKERLWNADAQLWHFILAKYKAYEVAKEKYCITTVVPNGGQHG